MSYFRILRHNPFKYEVQFRKYNYGLWEISAIHSRNENGWIYFNTYLGARLAIANATRIPRFRSGPKVVYEEETI